MSENNKTKPHRLLRLINSVEDSLLVALLSSMIILAIYQIISRNFYTSAGIVWIDPLLRVLVLWVGLAGAVVAARTDNHIRIDVFIKNLPDSWQQVLTRVVYLFTAGICGLIAWHSYRFVLSEYEYGTMAFAEVPAWVAALIIPLSFFLIAIRYGVMLFSSQIEMRRHVLHD